MDYKSLAIGVGIGILALPVMLALGIKLMIYLFKRKVRQLIQQNPNLGGVPNPLSINLTKLAEVKWAQSEIDGQALLFQDMGLNSVGAFAINEMPGVQFSAWYCPEDHYYGTIYDHPTEGTWIDICSQYQDGSTYTTSSVRETGLDQCPRHTNKKYPGSDLSRLVQNHINERPLNPQALSNGRFQSDFERSYRETREWRMTRGATHEEVQAVAVYSGANYGANVIDVGMTDDRLKEMSELQEDLKENFLKKDPLAAGRWQSKRLVFVHDQLNQEMLEELGLGDLPPGDTPRQRAKDGTHRCLATVSEPLEADVYALD